MSFLAQRYMGFESINRRIEPSREYDKKVREVLEFLKIEYSEDEKRLFDNWRENLPVSSPENPIVFSGVEKIIDLFPDVPNYTNESIGFFFKLENGESLVSILKKFAFQNKTFEIGVTKIGECAWLEVGSKTGHSGPRGGEFVGHVHPTQFIRNPNTDIFSTGLIPSPGDISGFIKSIETITSGTVICSRFGISTIKPTDKIVATEELNSFIQEYASEYFSEFIGKSNFSNFSQEDWKNLFMDKFGLDIIFEINEEK